MAGELRRPERLGDAGFALPRHGLGHRPLHGRQRRELPGTLAGRHLRRSVLRPPRGDDPRTPAAGLPPQTRIHGLGLPLEPLRPQLRAAYRHRFLVHQLRRGTAAAGGLPAARRPGRSPVARDRRRSPPGFLPAGLLPPARRRTDEPHDARRPAQPLVRTPGPRGDQCRARRGAALLRQPAGHHPGVQLAARRQMEPHDVHAPELRRRERLFQPAAPGNARCRRRSPAGIAGRRRGRHGRPGLPRPACVRQLPAPHLPRRDIQPGRRHARLDGACLRTLGRPEQIRRKNRRRRAHHGGHRLGESPLGERGAGPDRLPRG